MVLFQGILPNLITSASILLIAVFILIYFKSRVRKVLLFCMAVLVGWSLTVSAATLHRQQALSEQHEGKDLIVQGQVRGLIRHHDYSRSFLFDIQKAQRADSNEPINFHGRVRLASYRSELNIKAGESWQFQIRLKRSNGLLNPVGFDYEKWLFAAGIHARGYLRKSDQHIRLSVPDWYSVDALREKIQSNISQTSLSNRNKALVSALLLAEKSGLSADNWETFRNTGTSHLMAISGLHIGLVASCGLLLAKLLWWVFPGLNLWVPNRVAGMMLGVMLACFYALLAGMTIPTQRALVMVALGMMLLLNRRNFSSYRILSIALLVVLMIDPLAVMNVGFYLSFLAVVLILYLLNRHVSSGRFKLLVLQLGLSLLMLPLGLLFFGEGSIVSPLANIVAIPWVSVLVVPLSMLSVLLSFISAEIAEHCFALLEYCLDLIYGGLEFLAQLNFASFSGFHLPEILIIGLVFVALIVILPVGMAWRSLVGLAVLPVLFFKMPGKIEDRGFQLTILDVGQGLSAVIQTKHHTLVYDTGDRANDSYDLGERVVSPYLKSQGVKQVDAVVISHDDRDHMGGLNAVLSAHSVKSLYGNRHYMVAVKSNQLCEAGKKWQWDGVFFEFLHPPTNWQGNNNNRSCVLKVSSGQYAVMLTGDIQKKAEHHLLSLQNNAGTQSTLSANILLMPHHGSNTSSVQRFIKAVDPDWAIASAAYRSRFKHPTKKVVERYENLGIRVLNTADSGAIQFNIIPDLPIQAPKEFRKIRQRFWSRPN